MVESFIIFIEILQRPKKKNIIFEKITVPHFILISIFISAEIPAPTSAAKTTTKTIKPVRQKLINKVRANADSYGVILRILDQFFSIIIREFLANSTDLQRVIWKSYLGGSENDEEIVVVVAANITTNISYIRQDRDIKAGVHSIIMVKRPFFYSRCSNCPRYC